MWSWFRIAFFVINFIVSSMVTARSAASELPQIQKIQQVKLIAK